MDPDGNNVNDLRAALESALSKVTALENRLAQVEAKEPQLEPDQDGTATPAKDHIAEPAPAVAEKRTQSDGKSRWPLPPAEYTRYGRQLIMPEIGLEGQLGLKRSKVLIVGLGGLGCPAATYLAGAGVGSLGLVDDDTIALSNLHRQTLYSEHEIGGSKVENAILYLKKRNSAIDYRIHNSRLSPGKAIELCANYDMILDCTDHPSSRYFISDAAILAGKPLVSASALRTEGQLMVLNHPPRPHQTDGKGPCYRCVFPKPPPPESMTTCGEGGILGPVVGVMGILMAMEAIKILTSSTKPERDRNQHSLLLYSAYSNPPFRDIRLKGKRQDCISCSSNATITRESLISGSLDYIAFCGVRPNPSVLPDHERISAQEFATLRQNSSTPHILVDVREPVEFGIGHIEKSINIPFSLINRNPEASLTELENTLNSNPSSSEKTELYFICKLGNDSQVAVAKLKNVPTFSGSERFACKGDVRGGLWQWREKVDGSFPNYGGFPGAS